jgi:hypothetical protein
VLGTKYLYALVDHRGSTKLFQNIESAKKYAEDSWAEDGAYEWEHFVDGDEESWQAGEYFSITKTKVRS